VYWILNLLSIPRIEAVEKDPKGFMASDIFMKF